MSALNVGWWVSGWYSDSASDSPATYGALQMCFDCLIDWQVCVAAGDRRLLLPSASVRKPMPLCGTYCMHEYRNTSSKRRVSIKRRPRINIQRLFEADVDIPSRNRVCKFSLSMARHRFHNPHYNQYYLTCLHSGKQVKTTKYEKIMVTIIQSIHLFSQCNKL